MGQFEPTRQRDENLPPVDGSIVNLPLTTTVLIVDLTSFPQTAVSPQSTVKGSEHSNPLGQYMAFVCSVAWVVDFAGAPSKLTSLSATTTTTVPQSAGATQYQIPGPITNAGALIPANTIVYWRMPPGGTGAASGGQAAWGSLSNARYMGAILASGTGTLSCWVASR